MTLPPWPTFSGYSHLPTPSATLAKHESTQAGLDSMALMWDFCREIADEYHEVALAVSGSDSDLSRNKKYKCNKDKRKGHDNHRRGRGCSKYKLSGQPLQIRIR